MFTLRQVKAAKQRLQRTAAPPLETVASFQNWGDNREGVSPVPPLMTLPPAEAPRSASMGYERGNGVSPSFNPPAIMSHILQ